MVCGDAKNRINKNEKGLIESKRAEFYLNCSKKKPRQLYYAEKNKYIETWTAYRFSFERVLSS